MKVLILVCLIVAFLVMSALFASKKNYMMASYCVVMAICSVLIMDFMLNAPAPQSKEYLYPIDNSFYIIEDNQNQDTTYTFITIGEDDGMESITAHFKDVQLEFKSNLKDSPYVIIEEDKSNPFKTKYKYTIYLQDINQLLSYPFG